MNLSGIDCLAWMTPPSRKGPRLGATPQAKAGGVDERLWETEPWPRLQNRHKLLAIATPLTPDHRIAASSTWPGATRGN